MSVITVGRLMPEKTKLNKNGEERWIKGTIHLYGPCQSLLREIGQRKLPFTIVTGQVLPKDPVIIQGEITSYPIPNSAIIWRTLEIQKIVTQDSPIVGELGLPFQTLVSKVARRDAAVLGQLGMTELVMRKRLAKLVGSRNRFAEKLIELFGENAYEELVENPWKMIHLIPYFTMSHADKVAEKLGIPLTDERRFREHFRYLVTQSFDSHRNTYITENEFQALYWMHFSTEMTAEEYKNIIEMPDSPVIKTRIGYHPSHFYYAEKASYAVVIQSLRQVIPITRKEQEITEDVINSSSLCLTSEQMHAVCNAFHSPLHIITGGPGTGKTTVLMQILTKLMMLTGACDTPDAPFLLVAPTGKAAYRMWEQTGVTAHTIHSAFGIIPEYGCVNVRETARRLSHIRYLIVDEASMLDTKLFGDMCRVLLEMDHLPFLLLVGDVDQLPPVQHGQVFYDLLQFLKQVSPEQVTELTVLKRQADGSHIPELAAYIKEGQFPNEHWFQNKKDIIFVPVTMNNFETVLEQSVIGPKKGELETIQILTPYRNGDVSDTIYAINRRMAPLYNPQEEGAAEIICGTPPRTLRLGDKVINRTNRTKTIINGSIGQIVEMNTKSRDIFAWTVTVDFDGVRETYIYEELKTLELAYAITVHASQGSEYENVVVCILRGSVNTDFLNRNLLYVAVTRASKRLVLMGQISSYQQIAAAKQKTRKTALAYWLSEWEGSET